MLSPKEIYNAAVHNLALVEWVNVGESEWAFVGESNNFREEVLLSHLDRIFLSEPLYVVSDRHHASGCSSIEAVAFTRDHLASGQVLICDMSFHKYVQVNAVGVFRYGGLPANKSFKVDA